MGDEGMERWRMDGWRMEGWRDVNERFTLFEK